MHHSERRAVSTPGRAAAAASRGRPARGGDFLPLSPRESRRGAGKALGGSPPVLRACGEIRGDGTKRTTCSRPEALIRLTSRYESAARRVERARAERGSPSSGTRSPADQPDQVHDVANQRDRSHAENRVDEGCRAATWPGLTPVLNDEAHRVDSKSSICLTSAVRHCSS
jgi:hypothetical protein